MSEDLVTVSSAAGFVVIEWADGRLLRSVMNEQALDGGRRLPIDRATQNTLRVCDGLDYMHKHGVVHRDMKPDNVMVMDNDEVKLLDFGIAIKQDARRLTTRDPHRCWARRITLPRSR